MVSFFLSFQIVCKCGRDEDTGGAKVWDLGMLQEQIRFTFFRVPSLMFAWNLLAFEGRLWFLFVRFHFANVLWFLLVEAAPGDAWVLLWSGFCSEAGSREAIQHFLLQLHDFHP